MSYKYYMALTSQLPFCSVPFRIDTYSKCQYSCAYCFSRARGGAAGSNGNQEINPEALRKRLVRASNGNCRGAVDQFLARRIPLQLGGMNDPFSPWEEKRERTYQTLCVLTEFDYPTILSTKGTSLAESRYAEVLANGNFCVRVSVSLVDSLIVKDLEKGVPSVHDRLSACAELASRNVPVSLRVQPVIPGYEKRIGEVVEEALCAGVKHITAEYLKLPLERSSRQSAFLERTLPGIYERYRNWGAKRIGRELVLPSSRKKDGLFEFRAAAREAGLSYGFADNEFLHLNPFRSCCNGADLFLRDASFFDANILGMIKRQYNGMYIRFGLREDEWLPTNSIFSHLNSNSRGSHQHLPPRERFVEFLRSKWNGSEIRGGPGDYWGVVDSGEVDQGGNKVFMAESDARTTDGIMS